MGIRQGSSRWVLPVVLAGCTVFAFGCLVVVSALAGWRIFRSEPSVVREFGARTEELELTEAAPSLEPTRTSESGFDADPRDNFDSQAVDPNTILVVVARGLLQVSSEAESWRLITAGEVLSAGQRFRTGALSSAVLRFADDSEVHVGPQTELSIDTLEVSQDDQRRIVLIRCLGESSYRVAAGSGSPSQFEVRTPAGVINTRRAHFRVFTDQSSQTRLVVDQGEVEMAHLGEMALVVAGQTASGAKSLALMGPFFHMEGEGWVTRVGESWRIAGSIYQTYAGTVTTGSPQVGDWAGFKAYVLNDGTRIVYQIDLIERVQKNQFELRGIVDSISAGEWHIAGLPVQVDESTWTDSEILPGEYVSVFGSLLVDGTLNATRVQRSIDRTAVTFEHTGVVQAITDQEWTISDALLRVDSETRIDPGAMVGTVVRVLGRSGENGAWFAESIHLAEMEAMVFSFTGMVASRDPWIVAERRFDAALETRIDPQIGPGDLVRVTGRLGPDGVWSASRVQLLSEVDPAEFDLWGLVRSTDPWDVGGVQLDLDEPARIEGKTAVSRLVHVSGSVTGGDYLAQEILGIDTRQGCLDLTSAIRRIRSNRITLFNMQEIPTGGGTLIQGELKTAAVVLVSGCIDESGNFAVSRVVVLHQLDELPSLEGPNR